MMLNFSSTQGSANLDVSETSLFAHWTGKRKAWQCQAFERVQYVSAVGDCVNWYHHFVSHWHFLVRLTVHTLYNLTSPYKKAHTRRSHRSIVNSRKKQNKPEMTQILIDRRVQNKLWNSHTIDFYASKNKLQLHTTVCINLRNNKMLSKSYKY